MAVTPLKPAVSTAAAVTPSSPEQTLVVTSDSVRYTFSSHWGGLKQVELLSYPESVDRNAKKGAAPNPATLNAQAKIPAMSLLGGEALEGDGVFALSQPAPGTVRAEKTLGKLLKDHPEGKHVAQALYYRGEAQYAESKKAEAVDALLQTSFLPQLEQPKLSPRSSPN